MPKPYHTSLAAFLLASTALSPGALHQLEMIQADNADLAFQYRFEGSDDSTRLSDSGSNSYSLQRRANGEASTDDIQFVTGFDGASQAYRPAVNESNYQSGAGLNTVSTEVVIGQMVTMEAVVMLDVFSLSAPAYIVSARPAGAERGYFFRQGSADSGDGRLFTTLGDTFGDQLDGYNPYNGGSWFYLALVADVSSGTSEVNLFGANLTAGETDVTLLASDNSLFQGDWSGSSQVGVGNFINGDQEYFQGAIDNLTLTNALLSESDLNTRLDALLSPVPEPSTTLLATVGLLGLARRRRH